ncbi:MAG: molybdopterin-dependent oxidoreductase, partial [Proteobacteria bacterium]|nr:molybdopterin-dependent oxidoreductase [Pseudomonadota bacterium]
MKAEKTVQSRRDFLKLSVGSGGALMVSSTVGGCSSQIEYPQLVQTSQSLTFAPDPWIKIEDNNKITVFVSTSELGQGIGTGMAQLIAEELDADW